MPGAGRVSRQNAYGCTEIFGAGDTISGSLEQAYRVELSYFLDLAHGLWVLGTVARDAPEALRITIAAERNAHENRSVRPEEVP